MNEQFIRDFVTLLKVPSTHPEVVWIVLPLLLIVATMTIYFARYKDEELGWNTALGNSMVLIFVSLDLVRQLFSRTMPGSLDNLLLHKGAAILVGLLFVEGLVLLFTNFNHAFPKRFAYFLSSPLAINLMAYTVIATVYSGIVVTGWTVLAIITLFLMLFMVFASFGVIARRLWHRMEKIKQLEHVDEVRSERKRIEEEKKNILRKEKQFKKSVKKHQDEVKLKQSEVKKIRRAINPKNGKKKGRQKTKRKVTTKKSTKRKKRKR